VVIENVVGLLSMRAINDELIHELIIHNLRKLGYFVEYEVLTASNYGVPQNRKRVIFIASLKDNIQFPDSIYGEGKKSLVTVGEALGNIPDRGKTYLPCQNEYQELMAGRKDIINHEPINHSKLVTKRMQSVPQGGNWRD